MNTNDVGFAFVSFKGAKGGKERPIFIVEVTEQDIVFYSITSQYETKSPAIQRQYYQIVQWQEAGLKKPSWIDIGSKRVVEKSMLAFDVVGELITEDIQGLADFIEHYTRIN